MSVQALSPGAVISSKSFAYTIVRVLGSGSFGITYLASTRAGNISFQVAIKEFFTSTCYRGNDGVTVNFTPTSRLQTEQSLSDFITEANRLKRICSLSRNIVNVNETIQANGTAYYVMEYLDGGNPAVRNESEAVDIVRQIANAVGMLHRQKLLHLDIKPDNVVMKRDETGKSYPVLIDFGVSKHFGSDNRPTTRLVSKGVSNGYAPQEQYEEIALFSPKYDIYALGALLLNLISGREIPSAFKVSPTQQELKALLPPATSPAVANAILHAMQPKAQYRTPDVAAFLAELSGLATAASPFPKQQENAGAAGNFGINNATVSIVGQRVAKSGRSAAPVPKKDVATPRSQIPSRPQSSIPSKSPVPKQSTLPKHPPTPSVPDCTVLTPTLVNRGDRLVAPSAERRPPSPRNGNRLLWIILAIVLAGVIASGIWYLVSGHNSPDIEVIDDEYYYDNDIASDEYQWGA